MTIFFRKKILKQQLLTLLFLGSISNEIYAAESELPRSLISAQIVLDRNSEPTILRGKLRLIKDLNDEEMCLLLPSQAPDPSPVNRSLIQRLKAFDSIQTDPEKSFRYQVSSLGKYIVTGSILKFVKGARRDFVVSFETHLKQTNTEEWLYQRALPLLLRSCPRNPEDSPVPAPTHFEAMLESPDGWTLVGPNSENLGKRMTLLELNGRDLTFALFRKGHYLNVFSPSEDLRLYGQQISPEFSRSLKQFYDFFSKLFGPLPNKSLVVIESDSLPLKSSAGLIIINKPRQKIFESLQRKYLNWEYWVIASRMAQQWYGNSMKADLPANNWFIEGMSEFATSEALKFNPRRSNIFNSWDEDFSYFEFSYSQFLHFSASWLFQKDVFADTEEISDAKRFSDSAYVRHVLALKQLRYAMGNAKFDELLRKFTQKNIHKDVSPEAFVNELRSSAPKTRSKPDIATQLRSWWSTKGWVKLEIIDFEKTKLTHESWQTTVAFRKNIDLPIPVQIQGDQGRRQIVYLDAPADSEGVVKTDILTRFEPKTINLDPNREIFQMDRFDTSSEGASFEIIPGTGHTFSDQNYTILWAPLALRNPGELSTLGLQIAVFKYLQSSVNAKVEVIPTSRAGSYQIDFQKSIMSLQSKLKASSMLDYYGTQLSSVGLDKTLNIKDHSLTLSGKVNHRRVVGQPRTEHPSVKFGAKIDGFKLFDTTPTLLSSLESSPGNHRDIPVYHRVIVNPTLSIQASPALQLNLSAFVGRIFARNLKSDSLLFRVNDPMEAGLRIDERNLQRTNRIDAGSIEAVTPLPIPWIADSVMLIKKLRFKLFYDLGFEGEWVKKKKLSAAGAGLILPIGGDVMGAGTLIMSNLSVIGVFYTETLGTVSYKPRILFNLSGNI